MANKFLRVCALLALIAASPAWSLADEKQGVAFESVYHEATSKITDPRDQVIRDADAWARFWDELYAQDDEKPPLPQIDFSSRMVIVAALGRQPSSHFDIEITGLRIVRGAAPNVPLLVVSISEDRPNKCSVAPVITCPVAPVITAPVHVVVTDVVRDVTFRRKQVKDRC